MLKEGREARKVGVVLIYSSHCWYSLIGMLYNLKVSEHKIVGHSNYSKVKVWNSQIKW